MPPNLSDLTPMLFIMGLTYLGSGPPYGNDQDIAQCTIMPSDLSLILKRWAQFLYHIYKQYHWANIWRCRRLGAKKQPLGFFQYFRFRFKMNRIVLLNNLKCFLTQLENIQTVVSFILVMLFLILIDFQNDRENNRLKMYFYYYSLYIFIILSYYSSQNLYYQLIFNEKLKQLKI